MTAATVGEIDDEEAKKIELKNLLLKIERRKRKIRGIKKRGKN
jgi:hypothetical protein